MDFSESQEDEAEHSPAELPASRPPKAQKGFSSRACYHHQSLMMCVCQSFSRETLFEVVGDYQEQDHASHRAPNHLFILFLY